MEVKVQKQIVDYFSFVEEFYGTSKACLKNCQECAIPIYKLIKRCRNVQEADLIGTPLEEFDDLQSRLSAHLHNKISVYIHEIKAELSNLEDSFEKLSDKHKSLLENCKAIDLTQDSKLVKGSTEQLPLKVLLEYLEDTFSFGAEICAQISSALHLLTFKQLSTDSLVDCFNIPDRWRDRIPEIILYTKFCSENKIE